MAERFVHAVSHIPARWANDVDWLVYDVFNAAQSVEDVVSVLGLKRMAFQEPDNVLVTGGKIDGVSVGTDVPALVVNADHMCVTQVEDHDDAVVNRKFIVDLLTGQLSSTVSNAINQLGNMAGQNNNNVQITGGALDGVVIGESVPAEGTFTTITLEAEPTEAYHAINRAWAQEQFGAPLEALKSMSLQDRSNVEITGGSLDAVLIGAELPARLGVFETLRAMQPPVEIYDAVNLQSMTSAIETALGQLGDVAGQGRNDVNFTGGRINGVAIGANDPAAAVFNALRLTTNQAVAQFNTISSDDNNRAGLLLSDNEVPVGGLIYSGEQSLENPLSVRLWTASLPLSIETLASAIRMTANNRIELEANQIKVDGDFVVGQAPDTAGALARIDGEFLAKSLRLGLQQFDLPDSNITLDTRNYNSFYVSLGETDIAIAVAASNSSRVGALVANVIIEQTAGGTLVNWPSNVDFVNGSPDYTGTVLGFFDVITLTSINGGATWYATSAKSN